MKEFDEAEIAGILREAFAEQSADDFAAMEQALLDLERDPSDSVSLQTVFRVCHTLKGDAQSLGFERLAELAHALEDLLAAVRSGRLEVAPALISMLLEALDMGRSLASLALAGSTKESPGRVELLERVSSYLQERTPESTARPGQDLAVELPDAGSASDSTRTLRVRVDLLDRLLNLAGEIAIGRDALTARLSSDSLSSPKELLELQQGIDPLVDELQEAVMSLRLVSIAPLFRQQQRLVRDAAIAEDKLVNLFVAGDGAELDTTIVDHLRDPLSHMIRNAIAHGIESPEDRRKAGKPPEGTISLSAVREGATVIVDVQDDGRGLDAGRIQRKAVRLGLIREDEELTDRELFELIFEAGFSMADVTSRIAGRGVGLDVVRRNVEEVGGIVSVDSQPGIGTQFRIELPLTVAIIDALGVGVGSEEYVIPLSTVVECLELPENMRGDSHGGVLDLRGRPLPFVRLNRLLGSAEGTSAREHIVVIQHRGELAGLTVDFLYGECQAVVKPLSSMLQNVPGIAGTTIRGDGRVALILDAPALLRSAVGWRPGVDLRGELRRGKRASAGAGGASAR